MASLKTSFFDLTDTVKNTIALYKQNGVLLAEDNKQRTRISTCSACPDLNDIGMCKLCGCKMSIKVRLEAAKCPASKWV